MDFRKVEGKFEKDYNDMFKLQADYILDLLKPYSNTIQLNDLSQLEESSNVFAKMIAENARKIEELKKNNSRSNYDEFFYNLTVYEQKTYELMLTCVQRRISRLSQKKE